MNSSFLTFTSLPYALAFCVVLGHCFPVYGLLKGGKGVATACGALVACSSALAFIAIAVFIGAFAITKIVSLASLLATVAVGFAALSLRSIPDDASMWIIGLATIVIVRHHANLKRLLSGQEGKFSAKKSEV